MIESIIFGGREQADCVLARVNEAHERVKGALPVDAGQYPAGSRYSALEPELLLWTIAVMADSAQYFFEMFVGVLSASEREAFWQDYLRLGELLMMPRACAPATHAQFRDWWHERLASDDLYLTAEARQTGYATAFEIPMPAYASPLRRAHNAVMLGSLPSRVRDLYGLGYMTEDDVRFHKATNAIHALCKRSPRSLAHGRSSFFYRWVTREENRRIEHGRPTPHLASPARVETLATDISARFSRRVSLNLHTAALLERGTTNRTGVLARNGRS
jgi:uncharacterized protein (DUF2236 family)